MSESQSPPPQGKLRGDAPAYLAFCGTTQHEARDHTHVIFLPLDDVDSTRLNVYCTAKPADARPYVIFLPLDVRSCERLKVCCAA